MYEVYYSALESASWLLESVILYFEKFEVMDSALKSKSL